MMGLIFSWRRWFRASATLVVVLIVDESGDCYMRIERASADLDLSSSPRE
jgi:hypothetical protein